MHRFPLLLSFHYWPHSGRSWGIVRSKSFSPLSAKPVNASRLSKRVSQAPAANSLPPNCEGWLRNLVREEKEGGEVRRETQGDLEVEREVLGGYRRAVHHAKKKNSPEQCFLSSCVQQKNRGNLFEFPSTSSSPPPSSHHHHPHHPTVPPTGGSRKQTCPLWAQSVHAPFFLVRMYGRYGKVVSLPSSLPLYFPPSFSPPSSFCFSSSIMCLGCPSCFAQSSCSTPIMRAYRVLAAILKWCAPSAALQTNEYMRLHGISERVGNLYHTQHGTARHGKARQGTADTEQSERTVPVSCSRDALWSVAEILGTHLCEKVSATFVPCLSGLRV